MNINVSVSVPLAPKSYGEYVMDPDDSCTQSGLHCKRETQDQGSRLLEQAVNKPMSFTLIAGSYMTVMIWSP